MKERNGKKVIWTLKAASALQEHISYLSERSPQAAIIVRREILKTSRSLENSSEIFQLDEYRSDPNQNIRRFFRWHYKIVYQVFEIEVVVLDIIHTSKNPDKYNR